MSEQSSDAENEDVPSREAVPGSEFERHASRAGSSPPGPIAEFWYSLRRSGKWWRTPILLALSTAGALLVLSGTAIEPLIYAIF
jgi:hypothetical protein